MSEALILVHHDTLSADPTDAARALIDEALATGSLIGRVRNAEENQLAVNAQVAIKSVRKQIEAAYRAAKDPLVQLGKKLDGTFRVLTEELDREEARIGQLAGEFALAERRRLEAERIAQQEALAKLEKEKHEAIAATSDPNKQSELLEEFSRRAAVEVPQPSAPTRAKGQKVGEEWVIEVVDLIHFARWAINQGRFECVGLEVKKSAVKELLNGGMASIPGLECKKVPKAGVMLPRAQKAIDV